MRGRPNSRMAALEVENWNLKRKVGDHVTLRKDSGDVIYTTTRSEAYVCESGYPVIFLTGVSGYYLLDRVKVNPSFVPLLGLSASDAKARTP